MQGRTKAGCWPGSSSELAQEDVGPGWDGVEIKNPGHFRGDKARPAVLAAGKVSVTGKPTLTLSREVRKRSWVAPAPHLPTELVVLMEGFRGPRDAAEGVGGFLPLRGGAEGLGGVEEGGRAAGPPAHREGTEIGRGLLGRAGPR